MSLPKPIIRVTLEGGRVKSVHSEIPVTFEVINRDDFNKPDRCFESYHAKEVPVAPCLKDSLLGREYRLFPTISALLRALLREDLSSCAAGPTKDLDGIFPPRMSLSAHSGWILVTEVYASDRPLAQRNPTWLRVYRGDVVDANNDCINGWVKRALEGSLILREIAAGPLGIPTTFIEGLETAVESDGKAWKAAIDEIIKLRRADPTTSHTFPIPFKMVELTGTPEARTVATSIPHDMRADKADLLYDDEASVPDTEGDHAGAAEMLQTNSFEELLNSELKDPKFAKDFSEAQTKLMAEADSAPRGQTSDAVILDEAGSYEEPTLPKDSALPPEVAPKKSAKKNAKKATNPQSEQDPAD